MQVSKILIILFLALAMMAFVASPAVAVEHPWEEGEGGEDQPDNGTPGPDIDITPLPEDGSPLWSSTNGPGLFWWHIVWDYLMGDNAMNSQVVDSESKADSDRSMTPQTNRMGSALR
jgi:hypothetical protein